jgi:hypothetical protein
MGPFLVKFFQEIVELGLLLQEVGARRACGLRFKVKCIRSWRPFCCGWPGRIRSIEIPSRNHHTESRES